MDRVVLHVDLDAFYAAVEEREAPSLKGKAVVVCMFSARGGDSGAVATPNYEARKSGIRSGMSIKRAKKLDPDALYIQARRDLYSDVSGNVMELLRRRADAFEHVSIDEAFLDVTASVAGDFKKAERLARRIKKGIKSAEGLTGSIGIGPNKLIAKMAASVEKPDGLTVVRPEDVEGFLSPLAVDRLWGVGGKTKSALEKLEVVTIGDLRKVELPKLIKLFGRAKGRWLYNSSRGIDDEAVKERGEREQIGRITTLEEDTRDAETISKSICALSREVYEKVRERGDPFRTVTFYAVTSDLKGHTRSRTLQFPTRDLKVMLEVGRELVEAFLDEQDKPIRRAGIRVSNFTRPTGQKTLPEF